MSQLSTGAPSARSASPETQVRLASNSGSLEESQREVLAQILERVYPQLNLLLTDSEASDFLQKKLGSTHSRSLQSIATESNHEVFRADLFRFAHELKASGKISLSLSIYDYLSESDESFSAEAGMHRDAIMGTGSLAHRLEFHSNGMGEKVFDPAVLVGMTAGTSIYRGVRFAGLSRLLGTAQAGFSISPWGARMAASSMGFAAEVPTFLIAEKGVHQLTRGPQDWSVPILLEEGTSLGLSLFFLKTFAGISSSIFYRVHGLNPALGPSIRMGGISGLTQKSLPFASGMGGVYVGHRLEAARREEALPDEANLWLDSAVFTLQFTLSGKLSHPMMGPRFHRGLQKLDQKSFDLESSSKFNPPISPFGGPMLPRVLGPEPSFATAKSMPQRLRSQPQFLQVFSKGEIREGGRAPKTSEEQLNFVKTVLARKLNLGMEDSRLLGILDDILKTPTSQKGAYANLLITSSHRGLTFVGRDGVAKNLSPVDRLQRGVWLIQRACQLDPFHRLHGTLLDALTQIAFEDVVEKGDPKLFAKFLDVLAGDVSVARMEDFYEASGLHQRYGWMSKEHRYHLPTGHSWVGEIRNMIFTRHHEELLEEIFAMYYAGGRVPYLLREKNFIKLRDGTQVPMDPELAFKALKTFHDYWEKDPEGSNSLIFIEKILDRAERSKASWIYIDRMFKALMLEDHEAWLLLQSKLGEMAWYHEFNLENILAYVGRSRETKGDLSQAAETITGSVHTGYLYSQRMGERLIRLYERIPDLTDPAQAQARKADFEKVATDVLRRSGGKVGREEVLSLLAFNPTPMAQMALRDIRLGNLGFEMVDGKKMAQFSGRPEESAPQAMLVYPNQRSKGEAKKHMISILDVLVTPSSFEELVQEVILYPQTVLHEYVHFVLRRANAKPQGYGTRWEAMDEEFLAFTEEQDYRLHQGYTQEWEQAQYSSYGWPGYLRSVVEQNYFKDPVKLYDGVSFEKGEE